MGIRAVSRLTGLNQETVLNILETAGQKAAAFLDAKIRNVDAGVIQADEIHCIVGCRQQNALPSETERGEQYTFLSVARQSKLIVNWYVGKRTRENAEQFLGDLKNRMASRFQLVTDNWKIYSGMTGAVSGVFGRGVDYCTETKYFARPGEFLPRRLISVRRRRRIGIPDMKLATTAHAERTNLSVRTFTRRFTRCTLGHSKKLENHKLAVALFVAHFNFCRVHSAHGQTPAMAAKLTDHAWTIEEMMSATI
jgi:IS1 family transposase